MQGSDKDVRPRILVLIISIWLPKRKVIALRHLRKGWRMDPEDLIQFGSPLQCRNNETQSDAA